MPGLEELYAFAQKDRRGFFPGHFSTIADAARVLLASDGTAEWADRRSADRPRCGFLRIGGGGLAVKEPTEAWARLAASPALDPAFLASLAGRVVGYEGGALVTRAPTTLGEALALASAPKVMFEAEELARDVFVRAKPFGAVTCPPIVWRASADLEPSQYERSALQAMHAPIIDAVGYGEWMGEFYAPARWFSFTTHGSDIPKTLDWPARDMGAARQFDRAQKAGVVTADGFAFGDAWNPFEPLLRIAWSGIAVEKVTAERVVLVVDVAQWER